MGEVGREAILTGGSAIFERGDRHTEVRQDEKRANVELSELLSVSVLRPDKMVPKQCRDLQD